MLSSDGVTDIIFDFDGVIADTNKSRHKILIELIEENNVASSELFTLDYLKGESSKSALRNCFPSLSQNIIEDIVSKRHNKFMNNLDKYCLEIEGATDTIKKIHNAGYKLTLATSNVYDIAIKMLDYLSILHCFAPILGNEEMVNGKGKKDYFKLKDIINYTINDQDKFIVIEDSYNGVKGAKNAGFNCIAFNSSYDLTNQLADFSVKNYEDIRQFFRI